jgi:hypothetical protein
MARSQDLRKPEDGIQTQAPGVDAYFTASITSPVIVPSSALT